MKTLTEATHDLGVTTRTLRNQIANGKLTARKIGKTWVLSEKEIERYRADSLGKPGRRIVCGARYQGGIDACVRRPRHRGPHRFMVRGEWIEVPR